MAVVCIGIYLIISNSPKIWPSLSELIETWNYLDLLIINIVYSFLFTWSKIDYLEFSLFLSSIKSFIFTVQYKSTVPFFIKYTFLDSSFYSNKNVPL